MQLTSKQRQSLKSLAHPLKPVVQVGTKGVGEGLVRQIADQLLAHELIKVRFNTESPVDPSAAAQDLCERTQSQLVQLQGRTLILYRRREKHPKIQLPPQL